MTIVVQTRPDGAPTVKCEACGEKGAHIPPDGGIFEKHLIYEQVLRANIAALCEEYWTLTSEIRHLGWINGTRRIHDAAEAISSASERRIGHRIGPRRDLKAGGPIDANLRLFERSVWFASKPEAAVAEKPKGGEP